MAKILEIRNSTAEFLTFLAANQEEGVQDVYKDDNIWATQAAMAELFGCSIDNIGLHLRNIFLEGELLESATAEKISVVQQEGSRSVNREPMFYNLDAIISVGDRVSSIRATQFRQWAGRITAEFAKEFAETEFEKYRVIQDCLFASDFDRLSIEGNLPTLPFGEHSKE